jgi:DNA repair protein RecO (recombination protein O)
MLASSEGIVLHSIKYGDNSLIVTVLTREFGRQSFIVNASRSRKSPNKANLLQPLFLLDLVTYQKQNREIQRIKELKPLHVYQNIPFDLARSTQVIFLAEILYKTINEEESYPELFDFIKNALLYFDLLDAGISNFHLYFIFRLSEYLGFLPGTEKVSFENWFDLKRGEMVPFEPSHPKYMNKEASEILIQLSKLKIQDLPTFRISKNMRSYLLEKLVDFYKLHFENLGEIKSLKVLAEVFE